MRAFTADLPPRVAKSALAAVVNGEMVDLSFALEADATLRLVTPDAPEALDLYRHSTAHLMAAAVTALFPGTQCGIGPSTDDGFFYDFVVARPFVPEDLVAIEAKMREIAKGDIPYERRMMPKAEAMRLFEARGEPLKVQLIDEKGGPVVSCYTIADLFVDFCLGPHVPSTGRLKAFKLLSASNAYWKGDAANQPMQRIYGTAFFSKKLMDAHLARIEEARKRDHRRIGKDLDLFSFHDEGPGFAFFHPNGMIILNEILDFWRAVHRDAGYVEVRTPIILSESLWHRSGHWDNYREAMYFTEIDEGRFAVKPMNCPGGLLIYLNQPHSYRDLPIRMAELGLVHRHEKSGVLHGLLRVRQFTQDDAHIFCLPEQLRDEVIGVIDITDRIYKAFGFEDVRVELATRPEKSIGTAEMWAHATGALEQALEARGIKYKINAGEGAFYAPKIEYHIRDCLGRSWQCGTIQVDMAMPERFDLAYVGADNAPHRPAMVHRAILGSIERFLGILIEHYGGDFPLWLSPVQVAVLPVSDRFNDYAGRTVQAIKAGGLRVTLDHSSDKVSAKIRRASLGKTPYMLILGEKEAAAGTVSVRDRTLGDLGVETLEGFLGRATQEIREKKLRPKAAGSA